MYGGMLLLDHPLLAKYIRKELEDCVGILR